jgi:hypothetical protein
MPISALAHSLFSAISPQGIPGKSSLWNDEFAQIFTIEVWSILKYLQFSY